MASGCRVRILAEWYDPEGTEEQEAAALEKIVDQVEPLLPSHVWIQMYIENNPPDDEITAHWTRR